ncbi:MAG: type II toxin-antitoxin system VapC family toxin [Candidatus Thermoplasmatota archaeon]|nr:type II toxin-antitoxin system VapC family toxin [Candidatus Thermoplasmatota archaeon]
MICLDSTFLIDFLRDDGETRAVAEELELSGKLSTTEINAFEIASGIEQSDLSDDKKEEKMKQAEALFNRVELLSLDHEAALKAAEIIGELKRKGRSVDTLDSLVAGIALTNGCEVIVTRNEKHFQPIEGVDVKSY